MKENINFTHLKNGEVIGLFAFKITSIPDISVIGEGVSLTDAENEYRAGNKNFNPKYGSNSSLTRFRTKSANMEFTTDSNGNIIIKDSNK